MLDRRLLRASEAPGGSDCLLFAETEAVGCVSFEDSEGSGVGGGGAGIPIGGGGGGGGAGGAIEDADNEVVLLLGGGRGAFPRFVAGDCDDT